MGFPGSVNELQRLLRNMDIRGMDDRWWDMLAQDPRAGVRNLYQELLKKRELLETEERRLAELWTWEKQLGSPGTLVAGVDEAGRGPLAGPVAAAAVILDPTVILPGLNDSKQLPPRKRARLAELIKAKAIAWAVGWASVEEIDHLNIRQASLLAMKRALAALPVPADFVLVDGKDQIPDLEVKQKALVKGDQVSASIAAASILAKVARDAYMDELHLLYPCYGFNKHKGYPTKEHYQALQKYGPSPVHRKSFGKGKMGR